MCQDPRGGNIEVCIIKDDMRETVETIGRFTDFMSLLSNESISLFCSEKANKFLNSASWRDAKLQHIMEEKRLQP